MLRTIYIGNLPLGAYEEDILLLFAAFGEVHSVHLVMNRQNGRSQGFGFVEMNSDDAKAAICRLNGTRIGKRALHIMDAEKHDTMRKLSLC
jgi:RNA recognition motif-containing protein